MAGTYITTEQTKLKNVKVEINKYVETYAETRLGDVAPSDFISASPGELVAKPELTEFASSIALNSILSPKPTGNSSRFRENSTRLSMNISIFLTRHTGLVLNIFTQEM